MGVHESKLMSESWWELARVDESWQELQHSHLITQPKLSSDLVLIDFLSHSKDPFRADRATGDPGDAHNSNFLHPVMYFYREPVKGTATNFIFESFTIKKAVESIVHVYPFRSIFKNY